MNLAAELEQRQQRSAPIRVGLVGVGQMGAGLVVQVSQMRGMDIVASADIDVPRAVAALRNSGVNEDDIVVLPAGAVPAQANAALAAGKRIVTADAALIPDIAALSASSKSATWCVLNVLGRAARSPGVGTGILTAW